MSEIPFIQEQTTPTVVESSLVSGGRCRLICIRPINLHHERSMQEPPDWVKAATGDVDPKAVYMPAFIPEFLGYAMSSLLTPEVMRQASVEEVLLHLRTRAIPSSIEHVLTGDLETVVAQWDQSFEYYKPDLERSFGVRREYGDGMMSEFLGIMLALSRVSPELVSPEFRSIKNFDSLRELYPDLLDKDTVLLLHRRMPRIITPQRIEFLITNGIVPIEKINDYFSAVTEWQSMLALSATFDFGGRPPDIKLFLPYPHHLPEHPPSMYSLVAIGLATAYYISEIRFRIPKGFFFHPGHLPTIRESLERIGARSISAGIQRALGIEINGTTLTYVTSSLKALEIDGHIKDAIIIARILERIISGIESNVRQNPAQWDNRTKKQIEQALGVVRTLPQYSSAFLRAAVRMQISEEEFAELVSRAISEGII